VDIILDAARDASARTGIGVGVILAASRLRHPLDARTLARLAARYVDAGVVGFGLSNDERRGRTEDFAAAFRIARSAGLKSVPHGGELVGPENVRACVDVLDADRIGHGVRAADEPALLHRLADRGITLEVCPMSNIALGIAAKPSDVPLRAIVDAGVPVALGADDPLLFGSRLTAQYEHARHVAGMSDAELAELARESVRASTAPPARAAAMLAGIDAWLASPT
jgi:adenosine deaminase